MAAESVFKRICDSSSEAQVAESGSKLFRQVIVPGIPISRGGALRLHVLRWSKHHYAACRNDQQNNDHFKILNSHKPPLSGKRRLHKGKMARQYLMTGK